MEEVEEEEEEEEEGRREARGNDSGPRNVIHRM